MDQNHLVVFEDVQGHFKGLEVVGAQENKRGPSVAGDEDAVVLALDPVGLFRCVGLDLSERKCVTHVDALWVNILTYGMGRLRVRRGTPRGVGGAWSTRSEQLRHPASLPVRDCQFNPRTVNSAASTPHCSSGER